MRALRRVPTSSRRRRRGRRVDTEDRSERVGLRCDGSRARVESRMASMRRRNVGARELPEGGGIRGLVPKPGLENERPNRSGRRNVARGARSQATIAGLRASARSTSSKASERFPPVTRDWRSWFSSRVAARPVDTLADLKGGGEAQRSRYRHPVTTETATRRERRAKRIGETTASPSR